MGAVNLRWVRSDTRQPAFKVLDGDLAPVNLSSATPIIFTVRLVADDTVQLTKTLAAAEIVVSGDDNNIATVTIDAGDTTTWDTTTEEAYKYDLQYTVSGVVVTPARGTITIIEDQTRA